MVNALYNTCWIDPWLNVAFHLEKERNIRLTYWIGYYNDNSEFIIPIKSPATIYHSRWDVWKGIFSPEIEDIYTEYQLPLDFIASYGLEELIAIKAMDRMDPDRYSFAFTERQRLFRNLCRKWFACIDKYNINLVIADRIPHRSYDYALYVVCDYLKIEYKCFTHTYYKARNICINNIDKLDDVLRVHYNSLITKFNHLSIKELKGLLDSDILDSYLTIKGVNKDATPYYMLRQNSTHQKNSNILKLGYNFFKEFLNLTDKKEIHLRRNKGFFLDIIDIHPYSKRRHISIEDSKYNVLQYGIIAYKSIKYKKKLLKYYQNLSEYVNLTVPYVYFGLHYQPEATSNPGANIFVDQYLAIEQLANSLPDSMHIYVKEHKTQFSNIYEGHKARFQQLYDDLLKLKNVKLVNLNMSSFDLIDNAEAVSTLTGTLAWEGVIRGKPAIIFGLSYFEICYGVIKIDTEEKVNSICEFIETFRYDERKVLLYQLLIQKHAPLAYTYLDIGKDKIDEDTCVNNIVSQLFPEDHAKII